MRDRPAGQRRAGGLLRGRRGGRAAVRGRHAPAGEGQGGGHRGPDAARTTSPRRPGRENWGVDGILCYSKICTHVGCPISLWEQQTHHLLCPCHQSTFDLADNGKVIFGPAARALPQLPLMLDDEGYLVAQQRLHRAGRPELLGTWVTTMSTNAEPPTARPRPSRRRPTRVGGVATWADDRTGLAAVSQEADPQGLPRPLVVHARRDRAVELRRPAAHRHVPDPLVQAEHGRGHLRRLLRPAPRPAHVGGLRLDAGHLLRRPRRPAHAADAPLVGDALHRRDVRAHDAGVLHRRLPQAARDQLGHRRRCCCCSASSRASPATRSPTTCSPAPACGSPTGWSRPLPVVGTYMSFFMFGGEFPGDVIIPRLYIVHVLLIPGHPAGPDRRCTCCCSSTRSTPSGPAPAAPTTTSSATR